MNNDDFKAIIFHGFTNREVDQMEQDAVDGYVSDNVERLVVTVKVTGDSRHSAPSASPEGKFKGYPRS